MKGYYFLQSLNRLIKSHRVKFLAILLCRLMGIRYISLRVDPAISCNLSCLMCSYSSSQDKGKRFTDEEMNRLLDDFLPLSLQAVVGCGYEPTMYKGFTDIIRRASENGVPYTGVTTNGQLLKKEQIESLIRSKLSEIIISMHGVHKDTYEQLMPGASHERLHEVLGMIDRTKEEMRSDLPRLRVNFAVNSRNLPEIKDFFDEFGKYNIQTLNFRPMFGSEFPGGLMSDADVETYRGLIGEFQVLCSKREMTLVANISDEKYSKASAAAIIFPEILYHMIPTIVWREDFNWKSETYRDFCKRIGYTRYLIKCMFSSTDTLLSDKRMKRFRSSGRYDVI